MKNLHGGPPDKERSKPAEKPSIIFVRTLTRKPRFKVHHKAVVVLDTNVVLDWLVFRNPHCTPFARAIEEGRLRWLVTEPMRGELAHVLGRGVVDAWAPDHDRLWESWHRLSETVLPPVIAGEAIRLRCTDADDQKFVDLAVACAQILISRDRAVLKLARRAQRLGIRVATPERWSQE